MDTSPHETYMRRCLELARGALASGDTPVGSLLTRDELIVGEGVEAVRAAGDVTAHAEIVALRAACAGLGTRDLSGTTLYTTVEPCVMCAYAIRLARVGMVVAGTRSADADRPVNGAFVLRNAEVLPDRLTVPLLRGVLEEECRAMLGALARPAVPREHSGRA